MIIFGTAISDEATYRRHALPGIEAVAEPGSIVLERRGLSLQRAYNEILDEAARHSGLEALVLPHQDLELRDRTLCARLREIFADGTVAIAGGMGSRGVRTMSWSLADTTLGYTTQASQGVEWTMPMQVVPEGPAEVEAVEGNLLALSPWAVHNLRFDLRFEPFFHGYDTDISFQARARGRRVMVMAIDAVHHTGRMRIEPREAFVRASVLFSRKWELPDGSRPAAAR